MGLYGGQVFPEFGGKAFSHFRLLSSQVVLFCQVLRQIEQLVLLRFVIVDQLPVTDPDRAGGADAGSRRPPVVGKVPNQRTVLARLVLLTTQQVRKAASVDDATNLLSGLDAGHFQNRGEEVLNDHGLLANGTG